MTCLQLIYDLSVHDLIGPREGKKPLFFPQNQIISNYLKGTQSFKKKLIYERFTLLEHNVYAENFIFANLHLKISSLGLKC